MSPTRAPCAQMDDNPVSGYFPPPAPIPPNTDKLNEQFLTGLNFC
jgi:hypothetical protein